MSAIQFRTTPKGDLPHYSYIFRKPVPLGTEMKNVECSRLGTMLHLEIQKGKKAMKTSNFQNVLGGTAACIKRLAIATKGCGQLTSEDTYFADSWFSSVKTSGEMAAAGVNYCGPVKTSHKGFSNVAKQKPLWLVFTGPQLLTPAAAISLAVLQNWTSYRQSRYRLMSVGHTLWRKYIVSSYTQQYLPEHFENFISS